MCNCGEKEASAARRVGRGASVKKETGYEDVPVGSGSAIWMIQCSCWAGMDKKRTVSGVDN